MNHPESLLVPVLMLSDYLLTVAGARLRATAYSDHFKTPSYELNPIWKEAIAKLRWFNWRHFALTVILGVLTIGVGESNALSNALAAFFFACILAMLGVVNGRHLGNIAMRLGRDKLRWDPRTEQIIGDGEAAKMLCRPYRAPWSLPDV